jgi:streptogramin lyase/predicted Ser/Thr protein kinase
LKFVRSRFILMPLSASTDPSVGSELLGYRLEELIGRGGMGVVYRAHDRRLERNVALKLLAPELAADQRFRERFLRESVLLASLDHANVIPIYDAGEADGRLFIVMRYVEGGDLSDLLRAGPLDPKLAWDLCSQVAAALDAAHERGLIHRDVKPSNVLLDGRRHVYLADFGLTRHIAGEGGSSLEARSLGTIDYIAPEQIRGEEIDGRADLYSLGCLLHECLTGAPPFRRPSELAVAFAHLEEEPPAPPGLAELMKKALAKDPEDRFQSGHELMCAARAELGLDAPPRRRWPLIVAAVVSLALVAAGSLAVVLTRGGSTAAAARAGRLLRIDPRSNHVTGTVDVGGDPTAIAFGAGHGWVSTRQDRSVWRIDLGSGRLDARAFPAGSYPLGVAAGDGEIYVPERTGIDGAVNMIDAASVQPVGPIPTGVGDAFGGPITSRAGSVWYAEELAGVGRVIRLERGASVVGRVAVRIPISDPRPLNETHVRLDFAGIAAGPRDVWVAGDALDRRVFRIDTRRRRVVAEIQLPFAPGGIAVGDGGVWVTGQVANVVARIDPVTNRVGPIIHVGHGPTGVAAGLGSVWVANTVDGSISRIDPVSYRVTTIPLKVRPKTVTVGNGAVWVAGNAG